MNNYYPSKYGIILANSSKRIISCNKTAEAILNAPIIINSLITSIIPENYTGFTVEETELLETDKSFGNIKYVYILKSISKGSDDFYKTILEASHDEIFVTDGKGITLYCNEAFEKNYGMKRSEMHRKRSATFNKQWI